MDPLVAEVEAKAEPIARLDAAEDRGRRMVQEVVVLRELREADEVAVGQLELVPERRLPADCWLPGHCPAQEASSLAVGKLLMSTPISAMIASALRRWTPVIVHSKLNGLACVEIRMVGRGAGPNVAVAGSLVLYRLAVMA